MYSGESKQRSPVTLVLALAYGLPGNFRGERGLIYSTSEFVSRCIVIVCRGGVNSKFLSQRSLGLGIGFVGRRG